MVLNKLRDAKAPVILAVNKVDNAGKSGSVTAPAVPRQPDEFPRYRTDSAETGTNVDTIAAIVRSICRKRSITSRKIILPIAHNALWPLKSSVKN